MSASTHPTYDAIIIGAGSIGTPAAMDLASSGLKVLVVDERASAGQGSNKAAIGGIRATHSDPAKIKCCQRSIEIFSTWQERFGDDIEWVKGGYSYVAYNAEVKATLQELLVKQKSYNLNIDWLEKKELLEAIPDLNPEGLLGGTLSPDDGSASPLLSIHAFFRRAVQSGAGFRFKEKVTGLIIDHNQIKGIRTGSGEYYAPVVINAAGGWARQVAAMAGMDIQVDPDSHEGGITEPVARFLNPMVVDIRPAEGSANYYFYQHKTGQIIFCITPRPNIWGEDVRETSEFLPMVARRMVACMPILKNIRVRRTWRGLYPMTPDGSPLVGWSKEVEGFLIAAGMCGQGYMLGPGVAEVLTRMVYNRPAPGDDEILKIFDVYRQFSSQEKLK